MRKPQSSSTSLVPKTSISMFLIVGWLILVLGGPVLVAVKVQHECSDMAHVLSTQAPLLLEHEAVASWLPAEDKINALARNQTWRDVGAAAGPLAAGACLAVIAPEMMHIFVALALQLHPHDLLRPRLVQHARRGPVIAGYRGVELPASFGSK